MLDYIIANWWQLLVSAWFGGYISWIKAGAITEKSEGRPLPASALALFVIWPILMFMPHKEDAKKLGETAKPTSQ